MSIDYHDRPELSASQVVSFLRDPIAWWYVERERAWAKSGPTEPMKLGTAVHKMIELGGPDHVRKHVPAEVLNASGHCRGKAWEAWEAANPALEYVKPGEDDRLGIIWAHLRLSSDVWPLVINGESEREIIWRHGPSGIMCRSRLDKVWGGLVVDWKTIAEINNRDKLVSDLASRLYHIQLAFYQEAYRAEFGTIPHVAVVAIKNDRGYGNRFLKFDESWMSESRDYLDRIMDRIAAFDIQDELNKGIESASRPKWLAFQQD